MKTKTSTMTKVSQEDPVSGFLHTQYGEWYRFSSLLGTFRLDYGSAIVRVQVCKTRSCASDCYSNLTTSCSVLHASINPVDLRDLSSFQSHTRIRFLYSQSKQSEINLDNLSSVLSRGYTVNCCVQLVFYITPTKDARCTELVGKR